MYRTKVLTFILLNIALVASEVTNTTTKCDSQKIKDVSNDLIQCLNDVLSTYGTDKASLKCKNILDFNDTLQTYRVTYEKECSVILNNTDIFLRTVNKTMGNNDFKDLYDNRECFKGVNDKITECIKNSLGHTNVSLSLLEKVESMYEYDARSCDSTMKLKNCTLKVLNGSCKKTVPYISSAFDDVLKNCDTVSPGNLKGDTPAAKSKVLIYVGGSLAAIVGLIIIIVFVKKIINNKKKSDSTIMYSPNRSS